MQDTLVYACPHCDDEQHDPWEVLQAGQDHELTCGKCRKTFFMRLVECPHCVADNVFVGEQGPPKTEGAVCSCCGRGLVEHGQEADASDC